MYDLLEEYIEFGSKINNTLILGAETYAGPSENSEPETRAVQEVLSSNKGLFEAFFNIHR